MTAVLHKDDTRVRSLVDDWKKLFAHVLTTPHRARRTA
jgi:hypothetical protein